MAQRSGLVHQLSSPEAKIALFRSLFRGRGSVRYLLVLRGGMGRKQRQAVADRLAAIPRDQVFHCFTAPADHVSLSTTSLSHAAAAGPNV